MAKIPGNIDEFDVDAIIQRAAERGEAITPLQVNLQRRIAPDPTREDPIDDIIDRAIKQRDLSAGKRGPTPQELRDRIQAGKLGARIEAKKQIDAKVRELGYSPYQERQFAKLEDQRAKLYEELAAGRWTPEQVQEAEALIDKDEDLILPSMITRKPTVQERVQARTFVDPINGMRYVENEKTGKPELMQGQPTNKEIFDLYAEFRESQVEILDDDGEKTGVFRDYTPDELNRKVADIIRGSQEVFNILNGGPGAVQDDRQQVAGGRPRTLTERDVFAKQKAAVAERQAKTAGRLQAIRQKAIEEGKTEAEADELVNRLSGEQAVAVQPAPTGHKLFKELPQDKQKELLENFRKAEGKRKGRRTAPRTISTPMGQITKPRGTPFKRETDASFINEYNTNEVFRRKTKIFERKAGALPPTWEDATDRERGRMVAVWNDKFLGFAERELSLSDMKAKIEADPELIEVLLKK